MAIHLTLRFLVEMGVLLTIGNWGAYIGTNLLMKCSLGLGIPLFIIGIWNIFGSPKARVPLNPFTHGLVEAALFTLAVLALYETGRTLIASVFASMVIFSQLVSFHLHQKTI
ncbi:YrdB family protein [Lysinibacillus capsici]|uniref:YrdB family protein n=1 Tax=Lysinibacillus capsici TaxID=2115968 RepID=UPI002A83E745|nr:YrdB family protein [Lysinibacillus capsici]